MILTFHGGANDVKANSVFTLVIDDGMKSLTELLSDPFKKSCHYFTALCTLLFY